MAYETAHTHTPSYMDWGVIVAGAVVACSISTVLVQFGVVVGLTQVVPQASADANITPALVLGTGIWLLWTQILASLAGGYLAGRMRAPLADGASEHERDMRDGVHGLTVWALASLMVWIGAAAMSVLTALTVDADPAAVADLTSVQQNSNVIFAFFAASTALVSAVLSWWAATVGGDHRDRREDHTRYFTFRVVR